MQKVVLFGFFLLFTQLLHAGPIQELDGFSKIKGISISQIGSSGPSTFSYSFSPRYVSVQLCGIVPHSTDRVRDALMEWNLSQKSLDELKIFSCIYWDSESVNPLNKLAFPSDSKPIRKLISKSSDAKDSSSFFITPTEANSLATKASSETAPTALEGWKSLLNNRMSLFIDKGISELPPIRSGNPMSPLSEFNSMTSENPDIKNRFSALIEKISKGEPADKFYCQLTNIEGTGVISLGSLYSRATDSDSHQIIDVQWFVSNKYYAAITLYEIWPVEYLNKPATLLWRNDLVSTPDIEYASGIERMAIPRLMIQEVKKAFLCFVRDLK